MQRIQFIDGANLSGLEKARLFQRLQEAGVSRPAEDILREIEGIDADPTAIGKVASFLAASYQFIAGGASLVSAEEQAARLAICHECPHLDRVAFMGSGSCRLCGCSIKIKSRATTFTCPLAHW
jgi:hypothetical protein